MRILRNERNWSQAQLATRLGISDSQVAHYETGDRFPSLPVLVDASRIFGVSTDFLLGLDPKRDYWIDVSGLSPQEIDVISTMVDSYRTLHK